MAVQDGGHRISIQRVCQTAASQKGKDLDGFSFDGLANGCVMEHGDARGGAQPRESRLQFHGLINGLLDELFDHRFGSNRSANLPGNRRAFVHGIRFANQNVQLSAERRAW